MSEETKRKHKSPDSPEDFERQNQLAAMKLAQKRLLDGSASDGLVIHYLKACSAQAEADLEKTKYETELLKAKKHGIESQANIEELYTNAIKAMQLYSGSGRDDDEDDEFI